MWFSMFASKVPREYREGRKQGPCASGLPRPRLDVIYIVHWQAACEPLHPAAIRRNHRAWYPLSEVRDTSQHIFERTSES
jgi:hypothetical protein